MRAHGISASVAVKVLVVGAGGIGGHLGARLIEAGADVTFLVRARRQAQLARDGLRLVSPLGDFVAPVHTVLAADLSPAYDVAILTCKAYDLDSALTDLVPAVHAGCAVLPLLNGMAHLEALDARFGASRVWGGTCAMAVTLEMDGTVRHVGPFHRVVFGERGTQGSPTATSFAGLLRRTRLSTEQSAHVEQEMWEKLVLLSALAALTCLFRASVGEILRAAGGAEAVERALATNIAIATAEGFAPRAQAVSHARGVLTDPASTLTASMLRDVERGGAVENEHIIGWMLRKAQAHGVAAAALSAAYTQLCAYEARRARA